MSTHDTTHDTKTTPNANPSQHLSWKDRFEEILKVKNIEDLKAELTKLAGELQKEIQSFHIEDHLSSSQRERVKLAEQKYKDVVRSLHRVQKQFDREFNKTLRLVKKTRVDAEKKLSSFRKKFSAQKTKITKAVKRKTKKAGRATGKSKR
jgi:hypothetical protein